MYINPSVIERYKESREPSEREDEQSSRLKNENVISVRMSVDHRTRKIRGNCTRGCTTCIGTPDVKELGLGLGLSPIDLSTKINFVLPCLPQMSFRVVLVSFVEFYGIKIEQDRYGRWRKYTSERTIIRNSFSS